MAYIYVTLLNWKQSTTKQDRIITITIFGGTIRNGRGAMMGGAVLHAFGTVLSVVSKPGDALDYEYLGDKLLSVTTTFYCP